MSYLQQESERVKGIEEEMALLKLRKAQEESGIEDAETALKQAQDAQEILQKLAQAVQKQAHAQISEVVSQCLSDVFGEEAYKFRIEFDRKRGRTEARLRFVRDGLDVDPMSAAGGGMIDVAAFALRVACLMLSRPRKSRVIILDEPFKFVSECYRRNVRGMLETLTDELGIQIILVTHIEELEAGKIIEI